MRPTPTLLPCPCGCGHKPVHKLNARRQGFEKSLMCPSCGLTARAATHDYIRAKNWNQQVEWVTAREHPR